MRRQPGQVVLAVGEQDPTPGRRMQAGHGVEEGRLAGPVRADQAEDLTLGKGEVEVAKGLQPAEALRQAAGLQQGHGASAPRRVAYFRLTEPTCSNPGPWTW